MFNLNQSPASILGFAILTGFFLTFAMRVFGWLGNAKHRYPPGPNGIPFFGNIFRLSKADFEELGKKYGDITYMEAFGQGILLLNSHTAAIDLLDRRGAIYSERPGFIVINALTRGLFLGAASYGEVWRKMRRAGHECLNKKATSCYYEIQQHEALIFTENLSLDSKRWHQEVYRASASLLLSVVYDVPPTLSLDDPVVTKFSDFDKLVVQAAYPGNYLVEFFTFMKYLPAAIAPWKRKAEEGFIEFSAFFRKLYLDVETQINEGDEKPGIAGYIIRERRRLGLNDAESSWLPAAFANGAASVAEALLWFFLAMAAYPEKQKQCQEELDAVVGRSRMPTFEDRDNLPYLKATVRELLRWRPISPLGTQHVTKQDDWYQGYLIPKGTMCFAHIWLMNRDRKIYGPDADDFNPDRFIDEHGKTLPALADAKDYLTTEGHVSYGFGPRICPGRYFANDALFIIIARLLWTVTISPVVDEQTRNPVLPNLMDSVGDGITMRPPSFECIVKHRFSEAAAMLAQTKELRG